MTGITENTGTPFFTQHKIHWGDARNLSMIEDASVQLVVTSPPYPMIAMWDDVFSDMNPKTKEALENNNGRAAFEWMHDDLGQCWAACYRVLQDGGLICINIGDATRSMNGEFALYPNHAAIVFRLQQLGFTILPDILWRKPSNAPNKYMGSGMLPGGAYVTYEHEYIIIARKGGKRVFKTEAEKSNRRRSAYFWEERNIWFSDLWKGLTGTKQDLKNTDVRERSAAFPAELPNRLILMYSVYGDTVLDPFLGTGTTAAAAMLNGRNSIGIEKSAALAKEIQGKFNALLEMKESHIQRRVHKHREFVANRIESGKSIKHFNPILNVPVMTKQERELCLTKLETLTPKETDTWICRHLFQREA